MQHTLFNTKKKAPEVLAISGKKKFNLSKVINAFGKIETMIFSILLAVIVVLVVINNVIE